jgi:mannose-6-phosphate isomerase-like protein (cupin superfamily)
MSLSTTELGRFVSGLAASRDRWEHFVSHSGHGRVYEQIWDAGDVNAWVICWSEGQNTGFHDHDDSAAAILVIEGQVQEDRLRLGAAPDTRVFGPGAMLFVPPTAIHRVLHTGSIPAVTIHAYAPPLRRTGAYRIGPGGVLERASLSGERELRAEPDLS